MKRKGWADITERFRNGTALIGSDAHYWPGAPSDGHKAFVKFTKLLKPDFVIMNGDVIDAATISRYPPIGWDTMPTVKQELAAAEIRLDEISEVAPNYADRIWTLGNHDARFETRLASVAPEFKGVYGISLKDHFPMWRPAWMINLNTVSIKHRFKGGLHAATNNALWSGRSMVTGHLHALNVSAITDYTGTRFGIDGGTLANPKGPQFRGYTEGNPLNWRQGFVRLVWKNGQLMWPEVFHIFRPGYVEYKGDVYKL